MKNFKKKSLLDIYFKMSLEEVNEYYQELRRSEMNNMDPLRGIKIRKALYRIIKVILWLDEISKKREIHIHGDQRHILHHYQENQDEERSSRRKVGKRRGKIYACTHMGRHDIESAIRGVNDPCYFVMADPGETYQNLDGLLLRVNGVTWFDMDCSTDKHYANERQLKVLSQGGRELVFPEAAYNLDPVEPVGKLHPGFVRRALRTFSYIVPVAMEQYEVNQTKQYVLNIGKNIRLHESHMREAEEIAEYIRNEMIQLRQDIWEVHGGRKPTKEEWEKDPMSLEKYKDRIDFMMRDVPSYYTIEQIVNEYYGPTEEMVKSLQKINYLR